MKKVFLEISDNSQENTRPACNFFKKETLAQVFSSEFCQISKNAFTHRTTVYTNLSQKRKLSKKGSPSEI